MGALETIRRSLADGPRDILALAAFAGLYWRYRSRQRFSAAPTRYTGPEQASSAQHAPASFASEHARR